MATGVENNSRRMDGGKSERASEARRRRFVGRIHPFVALNRQSHDLYSKGIELPLLSS